MVLGYVIVGRGEDGEGDVLGYNDSGGGGGKGDGRKKRRAAKGGLRVCDSGEGGMERGGRLSRDS